MSSMDTTTTEKYLGWTNYPTWAVSLWLSNDEGLYRHLMAVVETAKQDDWKRIEVADGIKDFVCDDLAPEINPPSFATDLLGYALEQVNWLEIADAFLDD